MLAWDSQSTTRRTHQTQSLTTCPSRAATDNGLPHKSYVKGTTWRWNSIYCAITLYSDMHMEHKLIANVFKKKKTSLDNCRLKKKNDVMFVLWFNFILKLTLKNIWNFGKYRCLFSLVVMLIKLVLPFRRPSTWHRQRLKSTVCGATPLRLG